MYPDAKPASLRLVVRSGIGLAALCLAYGVVFSIGLATLPSQNQQIQNPWFTFMEVLILAIAPTMVAFTVGVHEVASAERKSAALLGIVFMSMCTVLTCSVHFSVLTLSRTTQFAEAAWASLVFSFTWPSLAYALDILAWDVFFPLSALFVAFAIKGMPRSRLVRGLLIGSTLLAFLGLAGVPLANMYIRDIGIIGYAVLFPIAALLFAVSVSRAGGQSAAG